MYSVSNIPAYMGLVLALLGTGFSFYELEEVRYVSDPVLFGGIVGVASLFVTASGFFKN